MSTLLKAGRPTGRTKDHVKEQSAAMDEPHRINVLSTKSQALEMKRFCLERNLTVSDLIRNAVEEYMSKKVDK